MEPDNDLKHDEVFGFETTLPEQTPETSQVKTKGGRPISILLVLGAVVILLLFIAIPQSQSYRANRLQARRHYAHVALKNLAKAQENYYATHGTYARSLENLQIQAVDEVEMTIISATPTSWSAKARQLGTDEVVTYSSENGKMR
ncbi:MAG: hypothetical protein KKB20_17405 [Proteobacteria bacterium]|nr:hypothetical protein [Pseudomonadota bacterium]